MRECDILDDLLDSDFEGYELRSLINPKNKYYDKYEKREAIKKRQEEKERKRKEMEDRAKEVSMSPNLANDIKGYMTRMGIKHCDVAYVLGINQFSFSRWLNAANIRKHEKEIRDAIDLIVASRNETAVNHD